MMTTELARWMEDRKCRAAGQAEAYRECAEELRRVLHEEAEGRLALLGMVPEPSDVERGEWLDATRAYVENLEQMIDDCLPNVAPHGRRDSDVPCRRLVGD